MEPRHGDIRRRPLCSLFGVRGVPWTSEMVSSVWDVYFLARWAFFYCLYFDSHVSLAQSILDVWTLMLVTGAEHNSYHFVLRTGIQVEVSFQRYSWSRSRVFGDITSIPSKWGFQPSGVWHDLARSLTPLCETGYVTHLLRAWISPCGNWGV